MFWLILIFSLVSPAWSCPPGTFPIKKHPRTSYYRSDGTHVSASTVNTYCKPYRNLQKLKLIFEDKMPKEWPQKKEKFKKWLPKEKRKIIVLMNQLPSVLTEIGDLKILRAVESETPGNPATSSPFQKTITFYDLAMKGETKIILSHELAHLLYVSLTKSEQNEYWKASRWSSDSKNNLHVSKTDFSAPDGIFGPDEDFANDVELFISSPESFKNKFKANYDCISRLLGG